MPALNDSVTVTMQTRHARLPVLWCGAIKCVPMLVSVCMPAHVYQIGVKNHSSRPGNHSHPPAMWASACGLQCALRLIRTAPSRPHALPHRAGRCATHTAVQENMNSEPQHGKCVTHLSCPFVGMLPCCGCLRLHTWQMHAPPGTQPA